MLEDNALDVKLIQKTLSRSSLQFDIVVTRSGAEFISRLNSGNFDLILCDYQLPDFDALKALRARNQANLSTPFILITGAVSEEVAIGLVKEGAEDYILKDRMQRLPLAVEKAIRKQKLKSHSENMAASFFELTQRFKLAARTSSDIIWDYDVEKNLIYCSNAIEKIIGVVPVQNFHPSFLRQFIHPDDLLAVEKSLLSVIKSTDNRWRKIFRVLNKEGNVVWINSNALVMRNRKEQAIRIVGVMNNVTEVRRLQHELVDHELTAQRQMTQVAIQVQERERSEIGRELHDNVNQLLATAKIMIDTARTTPELHDLCLTKSQESIMDAIQELRHIAHSMMPPAFDNNRFEDILVDLVEKVNLTGKVNLEIFLPPKESFDSLSGDFKLAIYRIIQEQVSNILKHADAKNVSISLQSKNQDLILMIEDDGVGFDPQKRVKGIGLKNMESRVRMLNGSMSISSLPGQGCVIKVQIPVGFRNGVLHE
jgi:two-component system, NarL family, sensor histidine kinase UhpB